MNDSRFIELLNLYVDHQLTPAEAAELEAELARNPTRRRTHQQYCRMQKACISLLETERAHAPLPPKLARALADADRKITALPDTRSSRRQRTWWAAAGTLAAAACATLLGPQLLVTQNLPSNQPAIANVAPASPEIPTPAAYARMDDENIDAQILIATASDEMPSRFRILPQTTETRRNRRPAQPAITFAQPTTVALANTEPTFQWIENVELSPLTSELNSRPTLIDNRQILPRYIPQTPKTSPYYGGAQVEMTAFQFQK